MDSQGENSFTENLSIHMYHERSKRFRCSGAAYFPKAAQKPYELLGRITLPLPLRAQGPAPFSEQGQAAILVEGPGVAFLVIFGLR